METVTTESREDQVVLPVAVRQILDALPDPGFAERLRLVHMAATRAVMRLRDFELTRLEELAATGAGSDLALWEEVAPTVGASIQDVNGLIGVISEQFPSEAEPEEEDDFEFSFGGSEESTPSAPIVPTTFAERAASAEKSIQGLAEALRFEVGRFGKRVRNPAIVADRWNLLVDLQEFRGKCRAAIGELIFSSCNVFEAIPRATVVPQYLADVADSLLVRQAWVTLTRAVGPLNARLQLAGIEQQRALLVAVGRELAHFQSTEGYACMRAGDKRFVIRFAQDLESTLADRKWGKDAQTVVEGFAKFLDSLAVLNRREVLLNHDREAFAECGILLEQASLHLGVGDPGAARRALEKAFEVAMRLYGRDRFLDDHLVLRMRWPVASLVDGAIAQAIEELRECLAESGNHAPGTIF